jgi:hypothetical protein
MNKINAITSINVPIASNSGASTQWITLNTIARIIKAITTIKTVIICFDFRL